MEINFGESRLIQNPNQVYHNSTLRGKGTQESPLKVIGPLAYTPTGNDDTIGLVGTIAYDNDFLYIKTSDGWAYSALTLLAPTP